MNKDDIHRIARDAGMLGDYGQWHFTEYRLERFAELVAKAKAEELATALEKGPINDTAASIAIWIRQQ